MNQREALQAMDAIIMGAMKTVGLADDGLFKPADVGAGLPCEVYVDRAAQFFDDVQQVAGRRITIDLFRSQIATSARGDTVTIGAEVFTLQERADADDESRVRWVVTL